MKKTNYINFIRQCEAFDTSHSGMRNFFTQVKGTLLQNYSSRREKLLYDKPILRSGATSCTRESVTD